MGINTYVYRMPSKALQRLEANPDLIGCLCDPESHDPAQLGPEGGRLPTIGLGKRWEDILRVLWSGGEEPHTDRARGILTEMTDLPERFGIWTRYATAADVSKAKATMALLDFGAIRARCLKEGTTDWDGEVFDEGTLDFVLDYVRELAGFWAQAADAGDAIVIYSH